MSDDIDGAVPTRRALQVAVPIELAERLKDEAKARGVHRAVLLEVILQRGLDQLAPFEPPRITFVDYPST